MFCIFILFNDDYSCGPSIGVIESDLKSITTSSTNIATLPEDDHDDIEMKTIDIDVASPRVLYPCMQCAEPFFIHVCNL